MIGCCLSAVITYRASTFLFLSASSSQRNSNTETSSHTCHSTTVDRNPLTDRALHLRFNTVSVVLTLLLGGMERDCAAGRRLGSGSGLRRRLGSGWSARAGSLWALGRWRTEVALWGPLERELLRYWTQHLHSAMETHTHTHRKRSVLFHCHRVHYV